MRFLLVCMLMVIFGVSGFGQVRPDFFIEETSPTNSNFETYSQKNGLSRRASLANLRKYFGADVIYGSTPALTGNAENLRNKFHVVLPDSIVWFVDWNGDAARMGGGTGGGDVYSLAAVSDTTTVTDPREGDLAVAPGVLLIRATSAWLQFQGGDDWGDQVIAIDSTLRGDGTAGDPLRVNRDSFLTAAIIEDSLVAVREDILPTDLSFSGASSPVTLQSSTGADVSFLAGTGMGFSQTGNQLTLNNTGVTGSGTANYIPKFTGTSTIGNTLFQEVSGYVLRVSGSHNSNTTGLDIWASGSNPVISQTNDNNNALVIRTNGGSLYLTRRNDNATTMEINRGNNRTNLVTSLWVGTSAGTPAARLHTTGSGSTSATFSLLAENSSGADVLQVRDDGLVSIFGAAYTEYLNTKGIYSQTNAGGAGLRVRYSDGAASIGNLVPDGTTQLRLRGMGATGSTITFDVTNTSNTRLFRILDNGQTEIPIRSGTATEIGGFTSGGVVTNVAKGNGLTIVAGTLDVNRDSFPTFAALPLDTHLGNTDLTLTGNRMVQLDTATLEFFREDNDFPDYGSHTNFYERTGIDTFLIPVNTYEYPIVGKTFSLNGENAKSKLVFGFDPDWTYGGAFVGSFVRTPTEFDEGSRYSFLHNSSGAFSVIAAHDTVSRRVMFTYSREGGLTIDRRDLGNVYAEFKHSTKPGLLFTSNGITYDGTALGQTFISNNIETVPYETNFPTALTGWSTAPVAGSKYLSEIHLGNLRFSNDTLLTSSAILSAYSTQTANTGTETSLRGSSYVGDTGTGTLKAGNAYRIEARGHYTTDTINTDIEIRLKWNGTQIATTGARTLTVSEGGEFIIDAIVTVYALGSPGSLWSQGRAEFLHSAADVDVYRMLRSAANSVTVLETGGVFEITADWTTASTANSITCTNFVITPLIY